MDTVVRMLKASALRDAGNTLRDMVAWNGDYSQNALDELLFSLVDGWDGVLRMDGRIVAVERGSCVVWLDPELSPR